MSSNQTRRLWGVAIAAALGGFLFGFDVAVINGAVAAFTGAEVGVWLNDLANRSGRVHC